MTRITRIRASLQFATALAAVLSFAACGDTLVPKTTTKQPNEARGVYMAGGFFPPLGNISATILPDGRFFIPIGGRTPTGLAIGQGTASSGALTGTYQLFGDPKYSSGTIHATYSSDGMLNGTLSEDPTNLVFTGHLTPTTVYNRDGAPLLADLGNHWAGTTPGNQPFLVDITSTGSVKPVGAFSSNGCTFSGSLSPASDGNYYHVTATSAASACNFPANATVLAVLVKTTLPDGSASPQAIFLVSSAESATILKGYFDPNNPIPPP